MTKIGLKSSTRVKIRRNPLEWAFFQDGVTLVDLEILEIRKSLTDLLLKQLYRIKYIGIKQLVVRFWRIFVPPQVKFSDFYRPYI